jgi:hypothetical protein
MTDKISWPIEQLSAFKNIKNTMVRSSVFHEYDGFLLPFTEIFEVLERSQYKCEFKLTDKSTDIYYIADN